MSRNVLALVLSLSSLSLVACGEYGTSGQGAMAPVASVSGDNGSTLQPQPWKERTAARDRDTSSRTTHEQRSIRELATHPHDGVLTYSEYAPRAPRGSGPAAAPSPPRSTTPTSRESGPFGVAFGRCRRCA